MLYNKKKEKERKNMNNIIAKTLERVYIYIYIYRQI